ncbi:type I pantothenate kinase [Limosilactobacillus fastidiosus]|uniref:Pantothenate kinase n=1 Tax=Limosilactobacillus fastidiosus TaxID=2759855 RepID=A0A7W3TZ35_9LACO|nr:type I pantothenate kinase [Limosilactobacillus fastidiosus]MBB1063429.1 type I pantothenate kinase [Limosilactobacillus fastidiosus]MBB1085879.1 type I pantothenate kinase [Limosilactobacillus fastidiosus]MCD7084697.1 type I pantothenate kinase [Limosilactobacillus fastidiosus]MCD7085784.1 type I pantothenate kinase [Limosilactobacillus fastidiosus]MCD7113861.1 type I pantothenate kinase [Limosilactobacillus fastidiosus]
MDEWMNYERFERQQWHNFFPTDTVRLSQENLDDIKSLNDRISIEDVQDIYLPLIKLLQLRYQTYLEWQMQKANFLHQKVERVPYIIGIAGSVAVGKSTIARLLSILLNKLLPDKRVELMTTDGFLFPNAELKRQGILDRKGFPESYDMEKLLQFMNDVKAGKSVVKAPTYSHQVYDVMPDRPLVIDHPDILIVEGINTLQLPSNQQIYVSDYFDTSIYVDADPQLIEEWYLQRFGMLLNSAFTDPDNYYYSYSKGPRERAFEMAKKVWQTIDLPNLTEYILPTRNRANIILHKTNNHVVDRIYLKRG